MRIREAGDATVLTARNDSGQWWDKCSGEDTMSRMRRHRKHEGG